MKNHQSIIEAVVLSQGIYGSGASNLRQVTLVHHHMKNNKSLKKEHEVIKRADGEQGSSFRERIEAAVANAHDKFGATHKAQDRKVDSHNSHLSLKTAIAAIARGSKEETITKSYAYGGEQDHQIELHTKITK